MWRLLLWGTLIDGSTQPFVTTWQTSSANENISIPITTAIPYAINISWGDTQSEVVLSNLPPFTHTYTTAGSHNVSILGAAGIDGFGFFNSSAASKLQIVDIVDWGDGVFINNNSIDMFAGCKNLRMSALSASHPVFLAGATLSGMFRDSGINSALNWDLANNVTGLDGMFAGAIQMNQPINFTNMGLVTNMDSMFQGAISFNQPLNFEDTSNVVRMTMMFDNATNFNQLVNFNTSKVEYMDFMFRDATQFNRPVQFDTRAVITTASMFEGATAFNQPINFQLGNLANAQMMFAGATGFNQTVFLDTTAQFMDGSGMFANVNKCFNQTVNITYTSNANLSNMFSNVVGFQQNLQSWDTAAVTACDGFCSQCGLPAFLWCDPCGGPAPIMTAENVSVCNLPNRSVCGGFVDPGGVVDLCTLATASPNLLVECAGISNSSTQPPSTISPLFNITHKDDANSTTFVFTLPIDPALYKIEIGKVSQACYGGELSCEWQDPTSLEFQQSGCAVSRENVDLGSGVVGTECTCTHLTVFAIVLRSRLHLAPLCHAQEIDYALLALYAALACVLMLQTGRVLYHKLYKTARALLAHHSLLLVACVLRVVYLVLKPVIDSLAGLVLLGLLPSAIALTLFIHLLLVWASLQLSTLQASPFARFRKPFFAIAVLVFVLVVVLVVLVAVQPDVAIVQGGSYAFAALTLIVCVLVLLSGIGLYRNLNKLIAASASSQASSNSTNSSPASSVSGPSSSAPSAPSAAAPSWRELLRQRVLVVTAGLSVCLLVVACLWVAAVQTDIIVSYAATLATTASFYVFDWLSLCLLTWLFSKGLQEAVKRRKKSQSQK